MHLNDFINNRSRRPAAKGTYIYLYARARMCVYYNLFLVIYPYVHISAHVKYVSMGMSVY
jgi:hypothetical protein